MTRRELLGAGMGVGLGMAMPGFVFAGEQKKVKVVRTATDLFDLILPKQPRLRILQLADTHFGHPSEERREKDKHSEALIRELIATHQPDYLFHTGDFINNDTENVEFRAIDFMNELNLPWSVVFGNHDHPNGKAGQKSLADYYSSLGNGSVGFTEADGKREYCYRIDLRVEGGKPFATLLAFNTGNPATGMKVNAAQSEWFAHQIDADRSAGIKTPILVMQHIPTIEFENVYDQKLTVGRRGEKVCFEQDKGEIFKQYVDSRRVRSVFCGHDHVNDYVGELQKVKLIYGRCPGFNGYGDWERGARLIDIDTHSGFGTTKVVLGKAANEKPEWSKTLDTFQLG